jgi:hypothetical protein
MAVYYGLVTRQENVLAEYSLVDGDFVNTAKMLIRNTPASSVLKTYTQGSKIFNFYTHDSVTFLCYSDICIGRELALQFLTEMKRQFPAYENKAAAFAEVIVRLLRLYSRENIGQVDRFAKIEGNLERVIETSKNSIDRVVARGKSMSLLIEKTGQLSTGIRDLRGKVGQFRKGLWRSWVKVAMVLMAVVVICCYCVLVWMSSWKVEE